jgi:hypothetical protein
LRHRQQVPALLEQRPLALVHVDPLFAASPPGGSRPAARSRIVQADETVRSPREAALRLSLEAML